MEEVPTRLVVAEPTPPYRISTAIPNNALLHPAAAATNPMLAKLQAKVDSLQIAVDAAQSTVFAAKSNMMHFAQFGPKNFVNVSCPSPAIVLASVRLTKLCPTDHSV